MPETFFSIDSRIFAAAVGLLLLYSARSFLFRKRKRRGRPKSFYVVIGKNKNGMPIYQHRAVAEKSLGRKLEHTEVVHHINFRKDDNRPENLCVMSARNHDLFHDWVNALSRKKKRPTLLTQREKLTARYGGQILR